MKSESVIFITERLFLIRALSWNYCRNASWVSLDVFRKISYPKIRSEQTAWLSLLSTENLDENTVKFMIEELQKKVEEKDSVIDKKNMLIYEQNSAIERINAENEALKKQLKELSEHR